MPSQGSRAALDPAPQTGSLNPVTQPHCTQVNTAKLKSNEKPRGVGCRTTGAMMLKDILNTGKWIWVGVVLFLCATPWRNQW